MNYLEKGVKSSFSFFVLENLIDVKSNNMENKFTWNTEKCDEEIWKNGIPLGILYKDCNGSYGIPEKILIQGLVEKISNEIGFKIDFQYTAGRPIFRCLREASSAFCNWIINNQNYLKENNLIFDA